MTPNVQNLTSWKPGVSGNPAGRPMGRKNLATIIRELEDDNFDWSILPINQRDAVAKTGAPFRVVVYKALQMAIEGDIRAMEYLRRAGYGDKLDVTSKDREIRPPLIVSTIVPREAIPDSSQDIS